MSHPGSGLPLLFQLCSSVFASESEIGDRKLNVSHSRFFLLDASVSARRINSMHVRTTWYVASSDVASGTRHRELRPTACGQQERSLVKGGE